jgi:hypothetical protein
MGREEVGLGRDGQRPSFSSRRRSPSSAVESRVRGGLTEGSTAVGVAGLGGGQDG